MNILRLISNGLFFVFHNTNSPSIKLFINIQTPANMFKVLYHTYANITDAVQHIYTCILRKLSILRFTYEI